MELNEFTWNLAKQIKFELFYNNAVDHCNPYTDFYSDGHIENVLEHTLMVLSHAKNKSFYVNFYVKRLSCGNRQIGGKDGFSGGFKFAQIGISYMNRKHGASIFE